MIGIASGRLQPCTCHREVTCCVHVSQSLLDKTHSVLQSLVEQASSDGERPLGNPDGFPASLASTLSRSIAAEACHQLALPNLSEKGQMCPACNPRLLIVQA